MSFDDVIRRLRRRFGRRKSPKDKRRAESADTLHLSRSRPSKTKSREQMSASAIDLDNQLKYSPAAVEIQFRRESDPHLIPNLYAPSQDELIHEIPPKPFKRNPSKKKHILPLDHQNGRYIKISPRNPSPIWIQNVNDEQTQTGEYLLSPVVVEERVWQKHKYEIYEVPPDSPPRNNSNQKKQASTTHFPIHAQGSPVSVSESKEREQLSSPTNESGYGSGRTSGLELTMSPSNDISQYNSPSLPSNSNSIINNNNSSSSKRRSVLLGSPKSLEILNDPKDYEVPVMIETYHDDGLIDKKIILEPSLHRQSQRSHAKSELHIRPTERSKSAETAIHFLRRRVRETKYVTAVFESATGGLSDMIEDVLKEFTIWLGEKSSLLGIAVEMHWSVPEKWRSRVNEIKLKDGLHRELRNNNRRVLNIYEECREHLPSNFIESKTEENCVRAKNVNAFQGVYRRFYPDLLSLQDKRTIKSHSTYWTFENIYEATSSMPVPNPGRFLFHGQPEQLKDRSIVAINLATLRLDDSDVPNYSTIAKTTTT
jgi:hypothetical protein